MVGAVGIGLKAALKMRKLLIPLNEKNAKNTPFAQVRYTPGTRGIGEICLWRLTGFGRVADDCILSPIAIRNAGNFDGNVFQTLTDEKAFNRPFRPLLLWGRADDHLVNTKSQTVAI
jgi:hypothetical protein